MVRHIDIAKPKNFTLNTFSKLLWHFKFSSNWCLHPSITQQWKGLQAWFLHCLTLLHPEMCLQYVQYMYHGLIFVLLCVPILFADNARGQFAITQYGFPCFSPAFFHNDLDSLQRSFLHYCSFVTLEHNGHLTFQHVINYWGTCYCFLCFLPSLSIATGFMQRCFLHVCNTV